MPQTRKRSYQSRRTHRSRKAGSRFDGILLPVDSRQRPQADIDPHIVPHIEYIPSETMDTSMFPTLHDLDNYLFILSHMSVEEIHSTPHILE